MGQVRHPFRTHLTACKMNVLFFVLVLWAASFGEAKIERGTSSSHVESDAFTRHTDIKAAWEKLQRKDELRGRNEHVLFHKGGAAVKDESVPVLMPVAPHPVHRTKFVSGLQLLSQRHTESPVAAIYVWYKVGSRNEQTSNNGVAHFLEHLVFKGTHARPVQFGRFFNLLGGQSNAFTSYDETVYHNVVESKHLSHVLELEADRMRNARLLPEDVDSERTVVQSELGGNANNVFNFLDHLKMDKAFGHDSLDNNYGLPIGGDVSDVQRLTQRQVKRFYKHHYTPSNCTIIVVGDFDSHELVRIIVDQFRTPVASTTLPVAPPSRVLPWQIWLNPLFLSFFNPFFALFYLPFLYGQFAWTPALPYGRSSPFMPPIPYPSQSPAPPPPLPSPAPSPSVSPSTEPPPPPPEDAVMLDPFQSRHISHDIEGYVPDSPASREQDRRIYGTSDHSVDDDDDDDNNNDDDGNNGGDDTDVNGEGAGSRHLRMSTVARHAGREDGEVAAKAVAMAAAAKRKMSLTALSNDNTWLSEGMAAAEAAASFLQLASDTVPPPPSLSSLPSSSRQWTEATPFASTQQQTAQKSIDMKKDDHDNDATAQLDVYTTEAQDLSTEQAMDTIEGCLSAALAETVGLPPPPPGPAQGPAGVRIVGYTAATASQNLEQYVVQLPSRYVRGFEAAVRAGIVASHLRSCKLSGDARLGGLVGKVSRVDIGVLGKVARAGASQSTMPQGLGAETSSQQPRLQLASFAPAASVTSASSAAVPPQAPAPAPVSAFPSIITTPNPASYDLGHLLGEVELVKAIASMNSMQSPTVPAAQPQPQQQQQWGGVPRNFAEGGMGEVQRGGLTAPSSMGDGSGKGSGAIDANVVLSLEQVMSSQQKLLGELTQRVETLSQGLQNTRSADNDITKSNPATTFEEEDDGVPRHALHDGARRFTTTNPPPRHTSSGSAPVGGQRQPPHGSGPSGRNDGGATAGSGADALMDFDQHAEEWLSRVFSTKVGARDARSGKIDHVRKGAGELRHSARNHSPAEGEQTSVISMLEIATSAPTMVESGAVQGDATNDPKKHRQQHKHHYHHGGSHRDKTPALFDMNSHKPHSNAPSTPPTSVLAQAPAPAQVDLATTNRRTDANSTNMSESSNDKIAAQQISNVSQSLDESKRTIKGQAAVEGGEDTLIATAGESSASEGDGGVRASLEEEGANDEAAARSFEESFGENTPAGDASEAQQEGAKFDEAHQQHQQQDDIDDKVDSESIQAAVEEDMRWVPVSAAEAIVKNAAEGADRMGSAHKRQHGRSHENKHKAKDNHGTVVDGKDKPSTSHAEEHRKAPMELGEVEDKSRFYSKGEPSYHDHAFKQFIAHALKAGEPTAKHRGDQILSSLLQLAEGAADDDTNASNNDNGSNGDEEIVGDNDDDDDDAMIRTIVDQALAGYERQETKRIDRMRRKLLHGQHDNAKVTTQPSMAKQAAGPTLAAAAARLERRTGMPVRALVDRLVDRSFQSTSGNEGEMAALPQQRSRAPSAKTDNEWLSHYHSAQRRSEGNPLALLLDQIVSSVGSPSSAVNAAASPTVRGSSLARKGREGKVVKRATKGHGKELDNEDSYYEYSEEDGSDELQPKMPSASSTHAQSQPPQRSQAELLKAIDKVLRTTEKTSNRTDGGNLSGQQRALASKPSVSTDIATMPSQASVASAADDEPIKSPHAVAPTVGSSSSLSSLPSTSLPSSVAEPSLQSRGSSSQDSSAGSSTGEGDTLVLMDMPARSSGSGSEETAIGAVNENGMQAIQHSNAPPHEQSSATSRSDTQPLNVDSKTSNSDLRSSNDGAFVVKKVAIESHDASPKLSTSKASSSSSPLSASSSSTSFMSSTSAPAAKAVMQEVSEDDVTSSASAGDADEAGNDQANGGGNVTGAWDGVLGNSAPLEATSVLAMNTWVSILFPLPKVTYAAREDRAALDVINEVLVGGQVALLSLALIYEGLGSSVTCEYAAQKGMGWMEITAATDEAETMPTLHTIAALIGALTEAELPKSRVRMAQASTVMSTLRESTTTVSDLASAMGKDDVSGGDPFLTRRFVHDVAAITPEKIRDAAARFFDPTTASVVIVRPEGSLPSFDDSANDNVTSTDPNSASHSAFASQHLTQVHARVSAAAMAAAAAAANSKARVKLRIVQEEGGSSGSGGNDGDDEDGSDAMGAMFPDQEQPPADGYNGTGGVNVPSFQLPCFPDYDGTGVGSQLESLMPPMENLEDTVLASHIDIPLARISRDYTLPNGIHVVLVPKPSAPGIINIVAKVHAGSVFDVHGEAGLLARTLLRGCGAYSAADVIVGLEEDASALGASSGREFLTLSGYSFTHKFEKLLDVVASCLMDASLEDDDVAIAQAVMASIEAGEDGTDLASRLLQDLIFPPGHPFHPKPPGSMMDASPESVRKFYESHFLPSRTHIVITGGFEPESMASLVQDRLASWHSDAYPPELPDIDRGNTFNAGGNAEQRDIVADGTTEAVTFLGHMGVSVCSHEYHVAMIVNSILGGDTLSSRLGTYIRDKMGLTYGITSVFEAGIVDGSFRIRMQAKPEHMAEALQAAWQVIWQMVTYGVEVKEVEAAKRSLLSEHAIAMSDPDLIGDTVLRSHVCGDPVPLHEPWLVPSDILEVTTEKVNAALARFIDPWSLVRVTVAPEQVAFGNWIAFPRGYRPCNTCQPGDCDENETPSSPPAIDYLGIWCAAQPFNLTTEADIAATRPICLDQNRSKTDRVVRNLTLTSFGPINGRASGTLRWHSPSDRSLITGYAFRWACGCTRDAVLHDAGEVATDRFIDPNLANDAFSVDLGEPEIPQHARLIVVFAKDEHGNLIPGSFAGVSIEGNAT